MPARIFVYVYGSPKAQLGSTEYGTRQLTSKLVGNKGMF